MDGVASQRGDPGHRVVRSRGQVRYLALVEPPGQAGGSERAAAVPAAGPFRTKGRGQGRAVTRQGGHGPGHATYSISRSPRQIASLAR